MSDRPLDQVPLRDLFSHAQHHARDLAEHLDQNFLTKLQELDELVHPKADAQEIRDITVRSRAAQVLESDAFTRQLLQKMRDCLNAIDSALQARGPSET
jgi:Rod binding domain-containing protein